MVVAARAIVMVVLPILVLMAAFAVMVMVLAVMIVTASLMVVVVLVVMASAIAVLAMFMVVLMAVAFLAVVVMVLVLMVVVVVVMVRRGMLVDVHHDPGLLEGVERLVLQLLVVHVENGGHEAEIHLLTGPDLPVEQNPLVYVGEVHGESLLPVGHGHLDVSH